MPVSGAPQKIACEWPGTPGNTCGILELMSPLMSLPRPGSMKMRLLEYENWNVLTIVGPKVCVRRAPRAFDGCDQAESTVGNPVSPHSPPSAPKLGAGFPQPSFVNRTIRLVLLLIM